MDLRWDRFKALLQKKSIGGWLLAISGAIGHWQNAVWVQRHLPKIAVHISSMSTLLIVAAVVWFTVILLWPSSSYDPWLQFERERLQIQNTCKKSIFDVIVKIGENFVLETDVIPRIEGNSWVYCTKRGQPITRSIVSDARVRDIIGGGPQEIGPVLIAYKTESGVEKKYQSLALERPNEEGRGGDFQFFLRDKNK